MARWNRLVAMGAALLIGLAGWSAAGVPANAVSPAAPAPVVSVMKVRATISGTYATQADSRVLVQLSGTAKKAKVRYRKGTSKKNRYRTVKLRSGVGSLILPAGSRPSAAQGLAGGGLAKSAWVALTAAPQPNPTVTTTPGPTTTATPEPTQTPETTQAPTPTLTPTQEPPASPTPTQTLQGPLGDATDFSFSAMQASDPSQPMSWDRCQQQIRVMVDFGDPALGVPTSELPNLSRATAEVAAATGFKLAVVGTTDVHTGLPAGADIIIRFVAPPLNGESSDGMGGFGAATAPRSPDQVSWFFIDNGFVTLNAVSLFQVSANARLELYMHELGHSVGLDHATSTTQIMYPWNDNVGEVPAWGAGDLVGLAKLGQGYCRA
jgi:hypothetical protein